MTPAPRRARPVLLAIVAEGLASRLSFGIIAFTLPLYAHHLGLSIAEIGILLSLNFAASMILKPVMGRVADRCGLKPSLIAALALRSAVSLLLALAWLPWHLFAIRIAHGASRSLRDPAAYALIAERSAKQVLASSFAWYGSVKSVSGKLGHALAGVLLAATAQNFSLVFALSALLSLIPVFVIWRFVPARGPDQAPPAAEDAAATTAESQERSDAATADWRTGLRRQFLSVMGLGFLMSTSAKMIGGLFPVLAVEYGGLTVAQTGMIYFLAAMVMLVAGPGFGWLSDNVSRSLVLRVRGFANMISSLVFMAAPNLAGMLGGRLVDEVGQAAFKPAWGALMAQHSDLNRRNRAHTMAVLSLGEEAGSVLGPILAGFLWNTWGVVVMLSVRIGLAVVSEIYAIWFVKSDPTIAPPQPALRHDIGAKAPIIDDATQGTPSSGKHSP